MTYFCNFRGIGNYLQNNTQFNINTCAFLWPKYYIHYLEGSTKTNIYLRIEELNGGIWGTIFGAKHRPIASIDIDIHEDKKTVEIVSLTVNDELQHKLIPNLHPPKLSESDASELIKILLEHAENKAKEYKCNKIKHYVHPNLNAYNYRLKSNNFILTTETADDNPFWLKTYKYVKE